MGTPGHEDVDLGADPAVNSSVVDGFRDDSEERKFGGLRECKAIARFFKIDNQTLFFCLGEEMGDGIERWPLVDRFVSLTR